MNRNVTILSVLTMLAVMLMATVAVAYAATGEGGEEKVTLCHKDTAITVGKAAVAAHERHGDAAGSCQTDATPPEQISPEQTSPEETTAPDSAAADQYGGGQEKVTLCHKGRTITIGAPGQAAHERHGDTPGTCPTEGAPVPDEDGDVADPPGDGSPKGVDLYGDSAADNLRGGLYADFLQGGRGRDVLLGGPSRDYIVGVDGVAGNDVIDGGQGVDRCVGDEDDTFRYCDGNALEIPLPTAAAAQTRAAN